MNDLPDASRRFADGAAARGLAVEITLMAESTRTAEEAAAACGCAVAQIVKSLVFRGKETGEPYLLLVSGSNRVNEQQAAAHVGEALVRPNADYVREATGYAIGGIPPLAHKTDLRTFFDRDLLRFDVIWAAAGTPRTVFPSKPNALCEAAGARVIDLKDD